jgi:hypothetical protein
MNHIRRPSPMKRHVERVKNEFGAQLIGHRPTDDAPTKPVQHDSDEKKTSQRRHVRDIRDPQLVWTCGGKVPVDQIRSWPCVSISNRRRKAVSLVAP